MGSYSTTTGGKQDIEAFKGIADSVTATDYHRTIGLTKSGLLMLRKSPAHYWHWLNSPPTKSSPAMSLGTATHTLLFEPHKWDEEIIVMPEDAPDRPTAENLKSKNPRPETLAKIAFWEKFDRENEHKCAINKAQEERARGMVEAVRACPQAVALLDHLSAKPEVSIIATEVVNGIEVPCKIRCDLITEDGETIFDLKTTEDASEDKFSQSFMSNGYWMQAAHYILTARRAGLPVKRFVFCAVESSKPHLVSLYTLDEKSLNRAFDIRNRLVERLAECYRTGKYPTSNSISELTMPYYIN